MLRRVLAPVLLLLTAIGPTSAQAPRAPVRLRGPFGGVTADQFYQSGISVSAGQLSAEVAALRAEVDRAANPAAQVTLDRLADQAVAAADAFRQAAAGTADRGRLYEAHRPVDQAIRNLTTAVSRLGATTPGLSDALARVRYADQQVHTAMTGGDTTPAVVRPRAARLAAGLDAQAARLRDLVAATPALAADPGLASGLQAVAAGAARLRQTLDAGGTVDQAAPDFRQAATAWRQVADPLTRGFTGRAAVRLQAARVDGLFRTLSDVIPAAAGQPAYTPLPQAGFLSQGVLAVSPGDSGGPRVRVFHDLAAGLVGNPPGGAGQSSDFFAYDPNFRGGVRVAVADLTGDGVPDVVTAPGKGMAPLVRVFDGRTLTLTTEFMAYPAEWTGGVFVAAADLTPDGRAFVATGADAGTAPHVKVFDLTQGKEIDSFFPYEQVFQGGVRVALGDVTGDSYPDLVTGPGPGGGPVVKVFNGKDRAQLASFLAFDEQDRSGVYVAAAAVTRGRRAEVLVGAGAGGPPVARVFDALRGQALGDVAPYPPDYRGGVRVAAHDYDRDGVQDLVCAPGPSDGLPVRVFRTRDRAPLADFIPFEATFRGSVFVGGR